jgi:hypothetical protein
LGQTQRAMMHDGTDLAAVLGLGSVATTWASPSGEAN